MKQREFQELFLCPRGSRDWVDDGEEGERESWRLCRRGWKGGGGQVNNDGNQGQAQVQDSRRYHQDGDEGGEMQESYPEKKLGKKHGKPEGN